MKKNRITQANKTRYDAAKAAQKRANRATTRLQKDRPSNIPEHSTGLQILKAMGFKDIETDGID